MLFSHPWYVALIIQPRETLAFARQTFHQKFGKMHALPASSVAPITPSKVLSYFVHLHPFDRIGWKCCFNILLPSLNSSGDSQKTTILTGNLYQPAGSQKQGFLTGAQRAVRNRAFWLALSQKASFLTIALSERWFSDHWLVRKSGLLKSVLLNLVWKVTIMKC